MIKKFILLMLFIASAWGQTPPPYNIQISQQPLPIPQNIFANYTGVQGQTTFFYWIVARYGVGNSGLTKPVQVNQISLSGTVAIGWNAPASPTGYTLTYDVLRTSSASFPNSGTCTSCLVSSATSALTVTDTLGALSAYTLASYRPQPNPLTISLDNVNATSVLVNGILNGSQVFQFGIQSSATQLIGNLAGTVQGLQGITTPDGNSLNALTGYTVGTGQTLAGSFYAAKVVVLNPSTTIRDFLSNSTITVTGATLTSSIFGALIAPQIGAGNTQNWSGRFVGASFNPSIATGAIGTLTSLHGVEIGGISTNGMIVTEYAGLQVHQPALTTGSIVSAVGMSINNHISATNNTNLLLGTIIPQIGNWNIYTTSAYNNNFGSGQSFFGGGVITTPVGVAALPACSAGIEGMRNAVNDSNAVSFTVGIGAVVVAGGTTHVPVYCDGTNWRIG